MQEKKTNFKTILGKKNPIEFFFKQKTDVFNIIDFFILDEESNIFYDNELIFLRSQYSIANDNYFELLCEENLNLGCVFGIYGEDMANEEKTFWLSKSLSIQSNVFNVEIVNRKGSLINFVEKKLQYMFVIEY